MDHDTTDTAWDRHMFNMLKNVCCVKAKMVSMKNTYTSSTDPNRSHCTARQIERRLFDLLIVPLTETDKRTDFAAQWVDASKRLPPLDAPACAETMASSQTAIDAAFEPGGVIDHPSRHVAGLVRSTS